MMKKLLLLSFIMLMPWLARAQYYHETFVPDTKNPDIVMCYQGFSYSEDRNSWITINGIPFDMWVEYSIYLTENKAVLFNLFEFDGLKHDGVFEIPNHIHYNGVDYPVTEVIKIGQSNLKTVICPETVTVFGKVQLAGNQGLQSVILKGVKTIKAGAFMDCSFNIEIPPCVEYIGSSAFKGCTGIKDVSLEHVECIRREAFTDSSLKNLSLGFAKQIESNAFTNADSLESVSIAEFGADLLPEKAFYRCDRLRYVSLGEGLKEIGWRAFAGCKSIEEVSLPQSLTTIGEEVFFDNEEKGKICSALKKVNFPDNLKNIGDKAFFYTGIEELALPEGLTDLGRYAFSHTPLKSVRLPESLTYIPDGGFTVTLLQEVNIPVTCTSIGNSAFACCHSLEAIELPVGLKEIGSYAFEQCENLKEIIFPEGLEDIGDSPFWGDYALESVSFPTTIKKVRRFGHINGIKDIYCHAYFDAPILFDIHSPNKDITLHVPHDLMLQFHDSVPWCYFRIVDLEKGEPYPDDDSEDIGVAEIPHRSTRISAEGGTLRMEGCEPGDMITVCDLAGRQLLKAKANDTTAIIATSLSRGETAVLRIAGRHFKVMMR